MSDRRQVTLGRDKKVPRGRDPCLRWGYTLVVGGFPFAPGLQDWAPPEGQRQSRVPLPAEVETADRGLAQTLLETKGNKYVCSERHASVERTGGPEPHTEGSKSVDSE
jgi:hypothetical protein